MSSEEESPPVSGSRQMVISEKTATQISRLLEGVVQSGTGVKAQIDGYRVAGKTGTAQKFDPTIGRYSYEMHTSSFVGYVPVEKPAISMIVILDDPKGLYYGGEVAAPVFRNIASETLRYLRIPGKQMIPVKIIASRQRESQEQ